MPLGAMVGSFFSGDLANKKGRRKALLIFDFISISGCCLSLINNYFTILIGRFLVGVSGK